MAGLRERVTRSEAGHGAAHDVALRARRHRGRRMLLGSLAAAVAAAAVAFWAGTAVQSGTGSLPQHVSEPPSTVPISREMLVDAVEGTGTLMLPAGTAVTALNPPLSAPGAQPVISGFGWRPGTQVKNGDLLVEVAGEPIFLLHGSIPAYRDLQLGDAGRDVLQLQQALREIGFSVEDAEGSFGPSTAAAVAALYHTHGYTAPRRPSAPTPTAGPRGHHLAAAAVMLPVGSAVFVRHLPATVSAVHAATGKRLVAGATLLELTNGNPVANIAVDPSVAATLRRGMVVHLTTSEGSRLLGRVVTTTTANPTTTSATGEPNAPAPSEGSPNRGTGATVVVDLVSRSRVPVGTRVTALIIRAQTHQPVLVVPASAVQHLADGGDYVAVERGSRQLRVPVLQSITANGNVSITPAAGATLGAGEQVVIPN